MYQLFKLIDWCHNALLNATNSCNTLWLALARHLIKKNHRLTQMPTIEDLYNLPYSKTTKQGSIYYVKARDGYIELSGDKWYFIDERSLHFNYELHGHPVDLNDFKDLGPVTYYDDVPTTKSIK